MSLTALAAALGIFSPAVLRAEADAIPCNIGYSMTNVSDVDSRDVEAALAVWANDLGNQYGFAVKINLYHNTDKLVTDFGGKKLDFIVITSIDYLRMKKRVKVKPDMTQYRDNKPTVKYLVLTNTHARTSNLSLLKNKKMSILKANQLGRMFLDTLLLKAGLPAADHFFAVTEERNKESQAILDVFFGKSDVCVVTEAAFETMKELNPQVGGKLHVLAESPDLIVVVGIFQPSYPLTYKQRAMKAMSSDFKYHERGKQIMLLFNIEKMDTFTEGHMNGVEKLVAEYDRLTKRR